MASASGDRAGEDVQEDIKNINIRAAKCFIMF